MNAEIRKPDDAGVKLTKGERDELRKLVNERGRQAKATADVRKAELIAEFEHQLAEEHRANAPLWNDLTAHASKVIAELDAELARRCEAAGVIVGWRPQINVQWYGRGENADAKRRAELRKVAMTRIEEMTRSAKLKIDAGTLEARTALALDGLTSDAAQGWLSTLPSLDDLMTPLSMESAVTELDRAHAEASHARRALTDGWPS